MTALSDTGWRRLIHYCRRAADSPPEYVDQTNGFRARYTHQPLRAIIWADTEVRDALLVDDDFDQLARGLERRGCPRAFDLLDLMSAMTLEAEQRGVVVDESRTTRSTP